MAEKKKNVFFDFLNAISFSKEDLLETVEENQYTPYMINRYLSFSQDTVLYAQAMNELPEIDNAMHFDFLLGAIRKKKRFFEYKKKLKDDENIERVKEFYNCSLKVARSYLKLLSKEELEHIIKITEKGG